MIHSGNRYLTLEEMQGNALYIAEFMFDRGWTMNAICGMLGNMQTESTINPSIWESLVENDFERGYGLVQWTPSTKYIYWCNENNLNYFEMNSNLLRIIYEVEENLQWIHPTMSFKEFTESEETPYDLGMLFLKHYERPLNPNQPQRGVQADYWWEFLGNKPFPPKPSKNKKSKPYLWGLRTRRYLIK